MTRPGPRARAVVLAIATLACAACATKPTLLGDTHVGKGERYRAGRPAYDAFFEQTHTAQAEAMVALDEEHRAREPLERVMGEAAPSASVLGDRVVARAQKQRASGREERVADDATFSSTLAAALQSEASVARKQDGVATRASALSARADDLLTTVDRDFTSRKARDEVARELNAAKLILHAAALRTRTVANDADAFVKAASAARQAAPRAEPVAAAPPKDRKRARGKTPRPSADVARPSRPAAEAPRPARPAPEVPPPPPAKPADDFNP